MLKDIPVPAIHLIPKVDALLMELLESLSPEEWNKPTLAPAWRVKDIVAHLLDGNIRNLSTSQDRYFGEVTHTPESYASLVTFLNQMNHDWVKAMQRVSPQMLMDLLAYTNQKYSDHLRQLPPFGKAVFSVAWAGEAESQNWFHIAREYTEKWHHQQQIREATDHPSLLLDKEFYKPYLDTSFRALPYHFRNISTNAGDAIAITVTGDGGGTWYLVFQDQSWKLASEKPSPLIAEIQIDGKVAWRIFSKQITQEEMKSYLHVQGREDLATHVMSMIAVMA